MNIKAASCPQGQALQKYPSTERLFFIAGKLWSCLRQHAIVRVTHTLYPGNRYTERGSAGVITRPCDWRLLVNKSRLTEGEIHSEEHLSE